MLNEHPFHSNFVYPGKHLPDVRLWYHEKSTLRESLIVSGCLILIQA
jgi:hypothetical protein